VVVIVKISYAFQVCILVEPPDRQLHFCDGKETGAMLKIFKKIVGNNFQTVPSILKLSGDLHEDR
jgi:hypothetical protein